MYETLQPGKYYHIYNHAVGNLNFFKEQTNYEYFSGLYNKHVGIIADTYSYAYMPNHFHFLVRIKDEEVILNNKPAKPSLQFSKVFNAYAQAYNKMYRCRGTLFQRPFRRIPVEEEYYLKTLVIYIHNNPVNHGFCSDAKDYKWTSYRAALSETNPLIPIEDTIPWFDNKENFIFMHKQNPNNLDIEKWLDLK
jgi:putative transposase